MKELKATQKQLTKTMELLRECKLVSNGTFAAAGILRYGHCIDRLRKEYGVVIETITPRNGPTPERSHTYYYRLEVDPWCMCELEGMHSCEIHWPSFTDHAYEQVKDSKMMD